MSLRGVDLNLLAVFEAIERERSVTRAAEALGLSQPAVSHALNRLRDLLKDQLFIRSPDGMGPTPRAVEMAEPVRLALAQLRSTLTMDQFDPASAQERFSIAVNNFAAIVFAAPLATACARTAPHVRVAMRPSGTLDLDILLNRGLLDLAIGEIPGLEPDDGRYLLDDRYVAVMGRRHPAAEAALTAGVFAASAHLQVSSIGQETSFVDAGLAVRGLTRSIHLEAPYIATGPILADSEMIGVVARRIALELCSIRPIVWRELPIEAPPIRIGMSWPRVYDRKRSHRWLRTLVRGLVTSDERRPPT